MPTKEQLRDRLIAKLKELFQLDQPDLDFGFYRIMHAKAAQVTEFLEKDLLGIVESAFSEEGRAEAEAQLAEAREKVRTTLGREAIEPDGTLADAYRETPVGRDYLAAQAEARAGAEAAQGEGEIYDHLYRFFERYYDSGDFISRRYYARETPGKAAPYAIPYHGEEVKLHWANADQYYIKTTEYFSNFTFDLSQAKEIEELRNKGDLLAAVPERPMRVHFQVVDATEGEHGNVKAAPDQTRYFIIHQAAPIDVNPDGELVCRFEFRPDPEKTGQEGSWREKRNTEAVETILKALEDYDPQMTQIDADEKTKKELRERLRTSADEYLRLLKTPAPTEKQKDRPVLARYVNQYTARNTMDYFIHKDLGGFFRRELDFYIKNEIMRLDDIEAADAPRVETYLRQLKILRKIAGKLIEFLAQLENFQKKLWLKKKFVVETNYCITLDRIPEEFYPEIAANDAQREEWIRLFAIDDIKGKTDEGKYSAPLTLDFLRANKHLSLNTAQFQRDFTDSLLQSIERIDEDANGCLVYSENFQALRLLKERYRRNIGCIYIDPPYNTGDSEILYKNSYLKSSWISLMENRWCESEHMLAPDFVGFVAIDDFQMPELCELLETHFPALRREMIVVNHHPQGGKAKVLANTHEYMLVAVPSASDITLVGRQSKEGIELRPFRRSGTAQSNYRQWRKNSFYAVLVDPNSRRVVGLEPPPDLEIEYPKGMTPEGHVRVYPVSDSGEERVWRRSYESCLNLVERGELVCSERLAIYQKISSSDRISALFSNWVDKKYNAGTWGANLVRDMLGIQNPFAYPKSVHTVADAIFSAGTYVNTDLILDFFAGSGTTGHAVIDLNRQDDVQRRMILVEMGEHFHDVLVPRIRKAYYSSNWKDGKPTSRDTGISHCFKYLRLESYEDCLNNLELHEDAAREQALAESAGLREEYMLRYMLEVETQGSASLLNIEAFRDPTAYALKVKKPGSDEYEWKNVDLMETFNWLIGLRVEHMAAPRTFSAKFKREPDPELPDDQHTKLLLDGRLKQDDSGTWWFRKVEGWVPRNGGQPDGDRDKVLIVWRKLTDDIERDNAVLDAWFEANRISTRDWEFDTVYVNGSNNLPNLQREGDTWKVRLIEEDFHRLMWDTEEG